MYCLNALVGNIQQKGGVYFSSVVPEFTFPVLQHDKKTKISFKLPKVGTTSSDAPLFDQVSVDSFANTIASASSGLIDTLLIIDANPMYHSRQKEKMAKALKNIPNVVVINTLIDETALFANLVLPDHSYLEKMDVSGPLPGLIFGHTGLQQPVIKPLFNTKQSGDILIESGKTLIGESFFPWKNYQELVAKRLAVLFQSGSGSPAVIKGISSLRPSALADKKHSDILWLISSALPVPQRSEHLCPPCPTG